MNNATQTTTEIALIEEVKQGRTFMQAVGGFFAWVGFVFVWFWASFFESLRRAVWVGFIPMHRARNPYKRTPLKAGRWTNWYVNRRDAVENFGKFWKIRPVYLTREILISLLGVAIGTVLFFALIGILIAPAAMMASNNAMRRM